MQKDTFPRLCLHTKATKSLSKILLSNLYFPFLHKSGFRNLMSEKLLNTLADSHSLCSLHSASLLQATPYSLF